MTCDALLRTMDVTVNTAGVKRGHCTTYVHDVVFCLDMTHRLDPRFALDSR